MKPVGEMLKTNERIQNMVLEGFDPVAAGGFTQIPNVVLRSSQLSPMAKLVYSMMLSYAWNNNLCFPGQEKLADDSGISRRSVIRSVDELVKQGWLEVSRRGLGKTNIYKLIAIVHNSVNK